MKTNVKEPVRLRERMLGNGNKSLYLDIYFNGTREYEFLKLYLVPESGKEAKERNKETLRLASAVKAQRVIDIQSGKYGFKAKKSKVLFVDYFRRQTELKKAYKTKLSWESALKMLQTYIKSRPVTINDIDRKWLNGYKDWIMGLQGYSTNTIAVYFRHVKTCLRSAFVDGLLRDPFILSYQSIPDEEVERSFLTIDELKRLSATPCINEKSGRAFLFSCMTGLRISDIRSLTWGDVQSNGEVDRIVFRQTKTKKQEYLDITPQASSLMGERKDDSSLVFDGLVNQSCLNYDIRKWAIEAGIDKHLSFHCARHTFAVMMLDLGTDIYTVSKLLGHRNLATTQIYAKILDKNKQAAVMNIPQIL